MADDLKHGAATPEADPRRSVPAVGELLGDARFERLLRMYGRDLVRVQARERLEHLRRVLATGDSAASGQPLDRLAAEVETALAARLGSRVRRVLNATGVFLHTNLGRAPLPVSVGAEMPALLDAGCDLEMSLETGRRSDRNDRAARLLEALSGAEAALVVNNNAAALLLILAVLAQGREVVVSRGELVEIGGSFRIPEILEAAGARLVEVGTTNRTHLEDYRRAIGEATAMLLKVQPSNYRISGFTASVAEAELVALGREHGLPTVVDEGSGLLRPHAAPQLRDHRSLQELVALGCDLACGSGDKLLGGPQAGIVVGRSKWIQRCRRHPLYRALRPDRMALIGLEAVLRRHLAGLPMPIDAMWVDPDEHRRRLERVASATGARIVSADAFLGGGSAPEAALPGEALALDGGDRLLSALRTGDPPVVAYAREGAVVLDLRTVDVRDDEALIAAMSGALERLAAKDTEGASR